MRPKVLLADDEDDVLALVAATLGGGDQYQLYLARDGEAALAMARHHLPDLVLLDVRMPGTDGYEVCRALKRDEATAHIKVVILSAMAQDADLQRAKEAGADDYFIKPFSPTALLEEVEELLGPQ